MPRALAYAKDLAARRRNGERVGLLVVSVGDWDAGKWYEGRPEVCRVMLPADVAPAEADWSVAVALDVVVCGDCPEQLFYEVCAFLERAGAASIWGDFSDGLWLLERGVKWWHAVEGPYDLGRFGGVLRQHRTVMMMLRQGFYASRIFDAARQAILQQMREVAA